jgi:hypothetical protein
LALAGRFQNDFPLLLFRRKPELAAISELHVWIKKNLLIWNCGVPEVQRSANRPEEIKGDHFLSRPRKAAASAAYVAPTRELHGGADGPVMRSLVGYTGGYMTPQQGGLPIQPGAVLSGAIGVSGAKSEEDEAIAQAGIDAL